MRNTLTYRFFPWVDAFGQPGWIVSLRNPSTGQRGQGFHFLLCEASRASRRALHRFNSGQDPLWYFDTPYVPEPTAFRA